MRETMRESEHEHKAYGAYRGHYNTVQQARDKELLQMDEAKRESQRHHEAWIDGYGGKSARDTMRNIAMEDNIRGKGLFKGTISIVVVGGIVSKKAPRGRTL